MFWCTKWHARPLANVCQIFLSYYYYCIFVRVEVYDKQTGMMGQACALYDGSDRVC